VSYLDKSNCRVCGQYVLHEHFGGRPCAAHVRSKCHQEALRERKAKLETPTLVTANCATESRMK
jgi:hypothetical protein